MKITTHGDTAIANYRFVVKSKALKSTSRRYRTTNVWMKRDGRWQIVAGHIAIVLGAKQARVPGGVR